MNLLGWRAAHRLQHRKGFWIVFVLAFTILVVVEGLWHVGLQQRLRKLRQNNAILTKAMAQSPTDSAVIADKSLARAEALDRLLNQHQKIQNFLQEMPQTLPPALYLQSLVREGHHVKIEGYSQSMGALSEWMRMLQSHVLVEECMLQGITMLPGPTEYPVIFHLTVDLREDADAN